MSEIAMARHAGSSLVRSPGEIRAPSFKLMTRKGRALALDLQTRLLQQEFTEGPSGSESLFRPMTTSNGQSGRHGRRRNERWRPPKKSFGRIAQRLRSPRPAFIAGGSEKQRGSRNPND